MTTEKKTQSRVSFYGENRSHLSGVHPSERMVEGEEFNTDDMEGMERRAAELSGLWGDDIEVHIDGDYAGIYYMEEAGVIDEENIAAYMSWA